MSDLTLEEFRGIVSEQDLLAMLRDDAFLIWGFHNVRPKTGRDCAPKKKGRFPAWATRFLRLSLRTSHAAPGKRESGFYSRCGAETEGAKH